MKLRTTVAALILFLSTGFTAHAQLDISVVSAQLTCERNNHLVHVAFDKSLHGILLDKQILINKTYGVDQAIYRKQLKDLEDNIRSLGSPREDPDRILETVYLINLNTRVVTQLKGTGAIATLNHVIHSGAPDTRSPTAPDTLRYTPIAFTPGTSKYAVVVSNATKNPSVVALSVPDSCKAPSATLPSQTVPSDFVAPSKRFEDYVEAVTLKDEANVFLDFGFDSRKNTKEDDENFYVTADGSFVPKRIKKLGLGGAYEIQPFFLNVKINSQSDSQIFTSELGSKVRHVRVFGDDGLGYSNRSTKEKLSQVW